MKLRYYTWWVSLLGILAFCACESKEVENAVSTDDDMVEVKLAFSAERESNASTRMTAENTQGNNVASNTYTYRGFDHVYLVPFSSPSTSLSPIDAESSIRLRKKNIFLDVRNTYQNTDNHQENRVYATMLVPPSTNSFLVYAWPDGGGADAASADKFAYGSLIPTGLDEDTAPSNKAKDITFKLDKVWDDDYGSSYSSRYNMAKDEVAVFLSSVANAMVDGEPLYKQKGDIGNLFSALSHDGLPFPYDGLYIQQKLKDLDDYFKSYLGSESVHSLISNNNYRNYYKFNTNGTWSPLANLQVYPYGMLLFKWEEGEEKFVVLDYRNSKAKINPPILDPTLLSYPAQLWYYANTAIHTSTEDLQNSVFDNTWSDVLSDSRFEANGRITNQTKVVAIDKKMEYAVGRMETKIHVGTSNSSLPGLSGSNINQLQLRGLMVTHQYKAGYDFQALETDNTESADEPYYIIYDRDVKTKNNNGETTPITTPGKNSWSAANHTLVLPSKAGEKVYVILEMFYNGTYKVGSDTSNAPTLIGYKGYPILPQSYFYMVGELDPGSAKAFESDKVATVKASINSFEGAYNYVPDLNSPALVLGLKVELSWQQTEPKSVWLH